MLALASAVCSAAADPFALTSPVLAPGSRLSLDQVFNAGDCPGRNHSPALSWTGAPPVTQSFAVTLLEPDAPGGGFWHWVAIDIPANVKGIRKGAGDTRGDAAPKGTLQLGNDWGFPGYGGPCPPPGDKPHHYVFAVHALDVAKLGLAPTTSPALAGKAIEAHTIARAELTGLFGR